MTQKTTMAEYEAANLEMYLVKYSEFLLKKLVKGCVLGNFGKTGTDYLR